MVQVAGTGQNDTIIGTAEGDVILGLAGDDIIEGKDEADRILGDFDAENLLEGSLDATSFAQYGQSGAWVTSEEPGDQTSMSQTVETIAGTKYEVSFELAANYGAGTLSGAVEVLWNGVVIDQFDTNSAIFSDHTLEILGTGEPGELTFRSIESASQATPTIDTDTPAFHYEKEVLIGNQTVTVDAFAEGQSNMYQVLNGTLHVFDPETETYEKAGVDGTVVVNSIGFNQQDDLIYGIAVKDGTDSLGNAVAQADIVMMDATGNSYRIGEGPYRAWTGDFDADGNLWAFQSSMDRISVIDVDQLDGNGNPISQTFKLPKEMVTDQVWDLAYDAASQSFIGAVRPSSEGAPGKIFRVDVSGHEPRFSTLSITQTIIDGVAQNGAPAITFGAAVIDGDGNIYVGGNGGDHDMDDATATSGGIYRVHLDEESGTAALELVTAAPKSYSNDGAMDPRAMDPFTETDAYAAVLIRSPSLTPAPDDAQSYDDNIQGNGGKDSIDGGYGQDLILGQSLGDDISGGEGDDALYGGAGPDAVSQYVSVYDAAGLRYDPFGNLLPEDNDVIHGGSGDDFLSGSAGHDTLDGGTGADILDGGTGHDVLIGGEGDDTLSGGRENDNLSGGVGNDNLIGGSGDDEIHGNEGDDTVNAGSGADTVHGGEGADDINASSGDDMVYGGAGNDRLRSGSGDDIVYGGEGRDYISSYTGDDEAYGGAGNDKIRLGQGSDLATGGEGSDCFVFYSEDLDHNTNVITDFSRNGGEKDRLDLRQMDLLDGQTKEDWLAENASYADNALDIFIGSCTIRLVDHEDLGLAFFDDVSDGLQL